MTTLFESFRPFQLMMIHQGLPAVWHKGQLQCTGLVALVTNNNITAIQCKQGQAKTGNCNLMTLNYQGGNILNRDMNLVMTLDNKLFPLNPEMGPALLCRRFAFSAILFWGRTKNTLLGQMHRKAASQNIHMEFAKSQYPDHNRNSKVIPGIVGDVM